MQFVTFFLFRLVILIASVLPFRWMYILSDITYFILYKLIRYRKKVVLTNLRNSFPEKSEEEINGICRKFYLYLSDLFFESLKGMTISRKELEKRHRYINPEVINRFLEKNQSVLGVTAHYGNWEWGAFSGASQFKGEMIAFYKPMNNRIIDRYVVKHRARFNCHLSSIGDTYYTFRHYLNKTVTYFMVADQSPSNLRKSYWLNFLNQDTAFIHGPEDYSRMYNMPVVFIEIRRVKRGYYEVYFSTLTENPASLEKGGVTQLYCNKLEEMIRREPAYWLWSHRRWKRRRSDIRERKIKTAQAS